MPEQDTYQYCGICGRVPRVPEDGYLTMDQVAPNRAPVRWWDVDDGWKIGALCPSCIEEYGDAKPDPEDFAYSRTSGIVDQSDTDLDIQDIIEKVAAEDEAT